MNKWRGSTNNTDNEFFLRIQEKGNRFIFVDGKADKEKANEQIKKSKFDENHFDATSLHIHIVKQFSKNG